MENRLASEKSPYLLQHKDNPVDWYPWGKEAFQRAAAEEKPIFLSIGYSTCHWCHVMAHESFEDPEIAKLLEDFVCIKVDREERPDVDAVYMTVCQALTGAGGWPLTIFMTPDQKPFFAGTYFPKQNRYGQLGLADLLKQISFLWKTQREKLLGSGERLAAMLNQPALQREGKVGQALLEQAYRSLAREFDSTWGGFGGAPKFPTPHNLLFLMRMYEEEKTPNALQMVETTLKSMGKGGIFDHIGGGFSRYSTDDKWLIPHFEKMLYDNALLILAYLEAYQLTQKPFYASTAQRTADYILQELTDAQGGFYCGQDADSGGTEGKFYGFTPDEVMQALGQKDGMEFCKMFNITDQGNFEGKSIPNRIGQTGMEWDAGDPRLKRLYEYRRARAPLHLDNKILLSWNGWAILAMARAGLILHNRRYTDAAVKAQRFIHAKMTDAENRLFLRYCSGEAAYAAQLDGYAAYALALLELYAATFEIDYLTEAILRAKQLMDLFEDKENGGYYLTAHDGERLIFRPKETYDGAIPSSNAVVEMVLEKLAALTGEALFREAADRQHGFMAGQAEEYPAAHTFALLAMAGPLYPHKELICTGRTLPSEITAYLREHPAQDLCVLFKTPENAKALSAAAPFTASYPVPASTVWYLCENGACRQPQTAFDALEL